MAEFKMAAIIKMSQNEWVKFFMQNGWIQDVRNQDGYHHQINQIELVWVRVRVEWECFWVNLREDNKVSDSKMAVAESSMAEFKMAAIINLSQNEWLKFFLCKLAESKMVEFKMAAIIKLSQNEWVRFFCWKWLNPRGRIPDGCHHQVESEWMSEVFLCANGGNQSLQVWVSLRGHTKIAESKRAKFMMAEFKMAAIIKLGQNKWVKFFCANGREGVVSEVFLCKWWEPILASVSLRGNTKMAESKRA